MGRLFAGVMTIVALALPAAARAQAPVDPTFYCQPDGPTGALNDAEHTVQVGDPKLPRGARQAVRCSLHWPGIGREGLILSCRCPINARIPALS